MQAWKLHAEARGQRSSSSGDSIGPSRMIQPGRQRGTRHPSGRARGRQGRSGQGCREAYHIGKGNSDVGSLHSEEHLVPVVQEVVDFRTVVQQRLVPGFRHQSKVILSSSEDEKLPNVPGSARHDSREGERWGRAAKREGGKKTFGTEVKGR